MQKLGNSPIFVLQLFSSLSENARKSDKTHFHIRSHKYREKLVAMYMYTVLQHAYTIMHLHIIVHKGVKKYRQILKQGQLECNHYP